MDQCATFSICKKAEIHMKKVTFSISPSLLNLRTSENENGRTLDLFSLLSAGNQSNGLAGILVRIFASVFIWRLSEATNAKTSASTLFIRSGVNLHKLFGCSFSFSFQKNAEMETIFAEGRLLVYL